MKILMSADTVGGVWRYALDLAAGLEVHDIDVHLVTLGAPLTPAQCEEIRASRNVTLHETSFRLEWMDEPWDDVVKAGAWLATLAREVGADVVHLNHLAHGDIDFGVPVLTVVHSCVLSWWRAVHGVEAPREWEPYRRRVCESLAASNQVVVATRSMQAEVQELYRLARTPHVIGNASRDAERLHQDTAVDARAPFVFSVGRIWDEAKNIAALDRVAAGLSWPVVVAGSNLSPDGRAQPLTNAHHAGVLSAAYLHTLLSRAAIYALPARYEPFGLSVLEAAHAGCALVLGDIESLRENWNGAALFVDPDDDEALAAAIRHLMTDTELAELLARTAQRRARSMHFADMVNQYLTQYHALLESVSRHSSRADAA
jgi:glycogen synthase